MMQGVNQIDAQNEIAHERAEETEFAGGVFSPGEEDESGPASEPPPNPTPEPKHAIRFPQPPGTAAAEAKRVADYERAVAELDRDLASRGWTMSADRSLKVRGGWSEPLPLKPEMRLRVEAVGWSVPTLGGAL